MLDVTRDGAVLRLTLARPEVRNALNDELIAALSDAFTNLDPEVRVVVLRGEGKSFCAGGDLNWMRKAANYTEEENYQDALKLANLFKAMTDSRAVVICGVQGAAFGGGSGLVAACDVAVAVEGTTFCFSEVRLGLVAATISSFVLPKIGAGHARALFTTAEVFDALHAFNIGLVHRICPEDELEKQVEDYVGLVLQNGPESVAISKQLAIHGPHDIDTASRLLAQVRASEEGREGVAAFLDKRPASFNVK